MRVLTEVKVAVHQQLGIGDLLCALPAIRGLRRWAGEPLHFTGDPSLLTLLGEEEVLTPARSDMHFDVSVNLHGVGPESHRSMPPAPQVVAFWDPLVHPEGPRWQHGLGMREQWVRMLAHHRIDADAGDYRLVERPPGEQIVLHVDAKDRDRHWAVSHWIEVAQALGGAGAVTVTGVDQMLAQPVAAAIGAEVIKHGLMEWQECLATARSVVTVDSGAAHLAFAHGRPAVVLYGPAPASVWMPADATAVALGNLATLYPPQPEGPINPHLAAISPGDVVEAVKHLR